jgi:hypothetical protein
VIKAQQGLKDERSVANEVPQSFSAGIKKMASGFALHHFIKLDSKLLHFQSDRDGQTGKKNPTAFAMGL